MKSMKCWTCGSAVSKPCYRCPSCQQSEVIDDLGKTIDRTSTDVSRRLDSLARVQQREFETLSRSISEGFAGLASTIEWGFSENLWQLEQQTNILSSIDSLLRNPEATQANEWRKIAEELRIRGVLGEAKDYFLKSLSAYPLDFRTYIGLAHVLIQQGQFGEAQAFLQRSLPHAPKDDGIDYRSLPLRLIGHLHECNGDFAAAANLLGEAIRFSPEDKRAHYSASQYAANIGDADTCVTSLRKAVSLDPIYWYLSAKEANFRPLRAEVEAVRQQFVTDLQAKAHQQLVRTGDLVGESKQKQSESLRLAEKLRTLGTDLDSQKIIQASQRYGDQAVDLIVTPRRTPPCGKCR